MEFVYELTKEDRDLFKKEFKKNKLLSQYYKADFSYWLDIIYVALCFCFCLFFLPIYQNKDITLIATFIITFIIAITISTRTIFPPRTYLYRGEIKGHISLSYENVNIYGKKNFFSFNTLQIKKVFETENFYSILVEHYAPCYTVIIIPKRLLKSEDENLCLKEYIENYRNKEKIQKPKFILYKYLTYISVIMGFLLLMLTFKYIDSQRAYNPELGMLITKVPVIFLDKDSPLKERGLSSGDIIIAVNNKYVFLNSPNTINNIINRNQNSVITVQKGNNEEIMKYNLSN